MDKYSHIKIEKKWQDRWQEDGIYKASEDHKMPKSYVLDMFPYPSGEGLHVGHPKGYIATDVYSRFKRMTGHNVLHPMGWDAFGLPAENYAIKNKVHPRKAVEKNVARFKDQLYKIGLDYDWDREINTTDPEYYKWTQWIFLKLYEKDLAYQSHSPINWCPSCQTGLANEDLEGGLCERCGSQVEKKPIRQWVLKITDYADRLLNDLDSLDKWPDHIKEMQRNWIGRKEGAEIEFQIKDQREKIKVFTTRPDTLFGATYLALSPEHKEIPNLKSQITNWKEVLKYIEEARKKTEIERTAEGKEKTGVELKGVRAVNPATGQEIPVWVADYVLGGYGTGSIMAVPAHDERDFEFAQKFNLPVKKVVDEDGLMVDSGEFSGIKSSESSKKITEKYGEKTITYRLQDWVFSRQRYWGEPIPIVHCEKCGVVPVPEEELPVLLPEVEAYEPTGTGESPLANMEGWVNTKCPKCDGPGRRETNTMPQWAGSCWYYLRFMDPNNNDKLVGESKEKYWSPVDVYVGGAEHATRHLIYARFWHKFLNDIGVVSTKEPFHELHSVGLIQASDGRKMSKRYGNVINPDDIIKDVGADTLRAYEMFMGPFENAISWSTDGIVGARRFIEKIWGMQEKVEDESVDGLEFVLHTTIRKVGDDIQGFKFNTAISQMMIFANEVEKQGKIGREQFAIYLKLLAPIAPHVTEELWHELGNNSSIHLEPWPEFDEAKIIPEEITIVVQVNGKNRGEFSVSNEEIKDENHLKEKALELPNVKKWVGENEIKKVIYVPGKLVNVVV